MKSIGQTVAKKSPKNHWPIKWLFEGPAYTSHTERYRSLCILLKCTYMLKIKSIGQTVAKKSLNNHWPIKWHFEGPAYTSHTERYRSLCILLKCTYMLKMKSIGQTVAKKSPKNHRPITEKKADRHPDTHMNKYRSHINHIMFGRCAHVKIKGRKIHVEFITNQHTLKCTFTFGYYGPLWAIIED